MRVKVDGGTPRHDGESLCDTCRWSRIIRGRTLDEEIVHCDASHMTPMRITFKVEDGKPAESFEILRNGLVSTGKRME